MLRVCVCELFYVMNMHMLQLTGAYDMWETWQKICNVFCEIE